MQCVSVFDDEKQMWGPSTAGITTKVFTQNVAFYTILTNSIPSWTSTIMWLHIRLEGKVRVCGIQKLHATSFLLCWYFLMKFNVMAQTAERGEAWWRGDSNQGKETSLWARQHSPVYWFPVVSFHIWNAPYPIDYDKRARQRPAIL